MTKPSFIESGSETLSKHINLGVHGDNGIGKTRLLGTAGRGGPKPTLFIKAAVSKLDSLEPEDRARAARGEIEVATIRDHDDLSGTDGLLPYLRAEGEKYSWVLMDDVQHLYDVGLDDLWEAVIAEKPARARYGLDKPEYGINMERLGRFLRYVLGPDKFNFAFAAWSEPLLSPDKDADGDPVVKLMPYLQGKGMALRFAGSMNALGFMTTTAVKGRDKPARVLRFESTDAYYAMDKFDAFNGRVLDPTIPKIEDLVKKSRGQTPAAKTTRPSGAAGRRPRVVTTARKS